MKTFYGYMIFVWGFLMIYAAFTKNSEQFAGAFGLGLFYILRHHYYEESEDDE